MNKTGIYIHIPFCEAKCPYCDFYSLPAGAEKQRTYIRAVCKNLEQYRGIEADTLYFGGGTPSILHPEYIAAVIKQARDCFSLQGEITMEANPCTVTREKLREWKRAGVNRLSFGMQSANEQEQRLLGRRHTTGQVVQAVKQAKETGFDNLSVDLMLAVPCQTISSLQESLELIGSLEIQHVSAYLLKIEEGTPFAGSGIISKLPDEDLTCELYLTACRELEKMGFAQYEISNFAQPGRECRHNLKYWIGGDYLGFGPAAHSFYRGKRFYYKRDLEEYIRTQGRFPEPEEVSARKWEDCLMLRLRLIQGVDIEAFGKQFELDTKRMSALAERYCRAGLMEKRGRCLSFTPKGFLVSNTVIFSLLEALENK